jgi:hypothetical protein
MLRAFLRAEFDRIAERLRSGGANTLTTEELWQAHRERLDALLAPTLQSIAAYSVDRGRQSLSMLPTTVDWNLVNRNAAAWSRRYTYDLVSGVTDTTRGLLQKALSGWIEQPAPLSDLIKQIDGMGIFGPVRSRMIAVTEATRVYAEGNSLAWEAAGAQPAAYKPPAHVNCRCYLQPKRLPSGEFVIVWYTGRDDLVCTRPVRTPWGLVDGCQALHKVVVSQGTYLGMKLDDAIAKVKQAHG